MAPFAQDHFNISELISLPTHTQPKRQSQRNKFACLCVFPMVVVATGAVLVGSGMGFWSTRASTRNFLVLIGMAVYVVGVFYFVAINLANGSCSSEEESGYDPAQTDTLASETVVVMDLEGFTRGRREAETKV